MSLHFHAYAYTGAGFKDSKIRARESRDPSVITKGVAPPHYPPLFTADPGGMPHVARLDDVDAAVDWLKGELTAHEPIDAEHFPVEERLEYSRARLQQTAANVVIYGYWSRAKQFVARRIYPCTQISCSG